MKATSKPYLAWFYEKQESDPDEEYYPGAEVRLQVDTKTDIIISVEYPIEKSDWADNFVGKSLEELSSHLMANYQQYLIMKDCW